MLLKDPETRRWMPALHRQRLLHLYLLRHLTRLNPRVSHVTPSSFLDSPRWSLLVWLVRSKHSTIAVGMLTHHFHPHPDALSILLEYYGAQDLQGSSEFLAGLASVSGSISGIIVLQTKPVSIH